MAFSSSCYAQKLHACGDGLALTDAQAQKLLFVVEEGEWTLQLRPVTDPADSPESIETVDSVLGDGLRLGQRRALRGGR